MLKYRSLGNTREPQSMGLGQGLLICISNQLPCDAYRADQGSLWTTAHSLPNLSHTSGALIPELFSRSHITLIISNWYTYPPEMIMREYWLAAASLGLLHFSPPASDFCCLQIVAICCIHMSHIFSLLFWGCTFQFLQTFSISASSVLGKRCKLSW